MRAAPNSSESGAEPLTPEGLSVVRKKNQEVQRWFREDPSLIIGRQSVMLDIPRLLATIDTCQRYVTVMKANLQPSDSYTLGHLVHELDALLGAKAEGR